MCRLRHRIGRRGYFLLTLAAVDFAFGYRFIVPDSVGQAMQNRWLAEIVPVHDHEVSLWIWALSWWMTGCFCLVNAFRRQDAWGYGMAFSLKVAFVAANWLAGSQGMPGSTTRVLVWSFIASAVLVIAKWPEPRYSFPEVAQELENTGEIRRIPREEP